MYMTGVCILLGFTLTANATDDDTEVARLRARIERLASENEALREAWKKGPDAEAVRERLALDMRLLERLVRLMEEQPDDQELKTDAAGLAKRIAPYSLGRRAAWGLFFETKVLADGMTVEQAENRLGPATELTAERIG